MYVAKHIPSLAWDEYEGVNGGKLRASKGFFLCFQHPLLERVALMQVQLVEEI
jgi:hypothetical protein